MSLLRVENLTKAFDGILAVDKCSFGVEQGSITSLIGPNGAGKTTTFNLMTGVMKPTFGKVYLEDQEIQNLAPHKIARMGMRRTFQVSRMLDNMSVLENVLVQQPIYGFRAMFQKAMQAEDCERAMELLDFVGIAHLADTETRNLSYGQKKLLDLASQLMTNPKVLMLDEPAGGINPALLESIIEKIHTLNQQGMTFLIVEHNMDMVMSISDSVIVMAYGQVLATGKPEIVRNDKLVLEAYLGAKNT